MAKALGNCKKRRLYRGKLGLSGAFLLLVFFAIAGFAGSVLVAPANRRVEEPIENLPIIPISMESNSGSNLSAWYIPANRSTATIVLLHPLRGDRRSMLSRAKLFFNEGYAVVLIDLQAHGESLGDNITFGYRERHDVRAAVDLARNLNPHHKIGVVGRSLGGASALLASPLAIDVLILESVYPTITEAVRNRIAMRLGPLSYVLSPALLFQLKPRLGITASDLRPIDRISQADCPILIAAGNLDTHTTLAETQRLFDAAREPKQLVIFEGAAHNDLLAYEPQRYQTQVLSFAIAHLNTSPVEFIRLSLSCSSLLCPVAD